MTKRLQFKVELQEALLRKEDGEVFKKKDDSSNEPKRISK